MSLFSSTRAKLAASKIAEEQLYAQAAEEVAAGVIRQGLWAKAIAESDGNEAAAKARYIKLRVELLIAEADLAEHSFEQASKQAAREAREARERLSENHPTNEELVYRITTLEARPVQPNVLGAELCRRI